MIEATTQIDFESHLEQNPDDWGARLVYADWLEEQGESIRANGQRWQAENQRRPFIDGEAASWFDEDIYHDSAKSLGDFSGNIPPALARVTQNMAKGFAFFDTVSLAETALANALHKLGIVSTCNATP